MNNHLNFSVGIPAFKSQYLFECINSILNQTYPILEIIIVNDCSPNPIEEVVGQFKDNRIKYFKNDLNKGAEYLVDNWNRCLENASGDYFVLMGDDDTMAPNYIEEFAALISKYPELDVYHCRSLIIDQNSAPVIYTPSWPEYESVYDNIWHRMMGYRVQFVADYVYRTKILKENSGFYFMPLGWYADNITSYIAMIGKGIAHVNKPLLNYRDHAGSVTSAGCHLIKMSAIIAQQKWFHEFFKNKPTKDEDNITHEILVKNIDKLIENHKIEAISAPFNRNLFKSLLEWHRKRNEYNLSVFIIVKSILKHYRVKAGEMRSKK